MKIFLFFILLSTSLFGAQFAPNPDVGSAFNKLQGIPAASKYQLGTLLRESHNQAICVYDFATLGGAIGKVNLVGEDLKTPCLLPGKSVIRNGYVDVTSYTGGTAGSISLSSGGGSVDLLANTNMTSFTAATEFYLLLPRFATASTFIKLSTANSIVGGISVNSYQVTATILGTALTTGHFRVFIDYSLSE